MSEDEEEEGDGEGWKAMEAWYARCLTCAMRVEGEEEEK